jgi:hypothetical protein
MQTSAAGNFQPTESLFAVYREPFFNTIDPKRTWRSLQLDYVSATSDITLTTGTTDAIFPSI